MQNAGALACHGDDRAWHSRPPGDAKPHAGGADHLGDPPFEAAAADRSNQWSVDSQRAANVIFNVVQFALQMFAAAEKTCASSASRCSSCGRHEISPASSAQMPGVLFLPVCCASSNAHVAGFDNNCREPAGRSSRCSHMPSEEASTPTRGRRFDALSRQYDHEIRPFECPRCNGCLETRGPLQGGPAAKRASRLTVQANHPRNDPNSGRA
jgi:hypothetical protein